MAANGPCRFVPGLAEVQPAGSWHRRWTGVQAERSRRSVPSTGERSTRRWRLAGGRRATAASLPSATAGRPTASRLAGSWPPGRCWS